MSTWQKGKQNQPRCQPEGIAVDREQKKAHNGTVRWGKEMAGRVGMGGGIVALKKEGLFIVGCIGMSVLDLCQVVYMRMHVLHLEILQLGSLHVCNGLAMICDCLGCQGNGPKCNFRNCLRM